MGPRPDGRGRRTSHDGFLSPRTGFNGAAAGWPRKVAAGGENQQGHWASMGPRPDGRGRRTGPDGATIPAPASMGPRPDGRGRLEPAADHRDVVGLQWGRGRMAAEGVNGRDLGHEVGASMGPRPDGRGRRRPCCPWRGCCCFNGAAAGWPRKGRRALPARGAPPPASMGPRPDGRGRHAQDAEGHGPHEASMGPRPDGRGRWLTMRAARVPGVLQWGRGRMAAEGREGGRPACHS